MLDALLDRSLVGGYTRLGYALRHRRFDPLPRMDGVHAVVTGATSGLGLAAAQGFADLGARVTLVARSAERGAQAQARVPGAALELCDLSRLDDVRALAPRLGAPDLLVNNAGVLTQDRETSPDGHELTLATNVLGPFLLTALLPATTRVVSVSSGGMYTQKLDVDDLQYTKSSFNGTKAYAKSKRAEVVLTELWAQRGRQAYSMHPGWVDTPGLQASLPAFHRLTKPLLRTPAQGADTIVWLGATPATDLRDGAFYHDRAPRPTHYLPTTRETTADRERLWRACIDLTHAP